MEVNNCSDGDNDETENQHMSYRRNTGYNNTNQGRDYNTESSQGDQHRYLSNLAHGRTINFYINGNVFFPCKRLVYNPKQFRDLSNYMDYLTEKLDPRFGAVRKICTPRHGSRILALGDLQGDSSYVVAGNEHFKPYRYDKISSSERKKAPPFNYSVDPVYHTRTFLSSGKIKKTDTHSLLIKVWPNGGDLKGPRRVLITPKIRPFTLSTVISHVNEMLKEDCMGTVEKLYFLTGTQVSDVQQIIQNGQYVACRKGDKFKRARYNEQAVKNIATSPRLDRKLLAPLFPRSINSTSQSSPDHSSSSTQNSHTSYPHRKKAADGDEERIFPFKPVKYTRGSDRGRTNGFDKDHGKVSKKDNYPNTRLTKEAADGRYSHRDLSGDQSDGQDVDDEPIPLKGAKKSGTTTQDNSGGHVRRQDMSTTGPHKSDRRDRRQSTDTDNQLEEEGSAARTQAGNRGYETRKLQRIPPDRTDQNHNMPRNTNLDQRQNPRHEKPIANSDNRQTIDKKPTSNQQIRNPRERPYRVREEEAAVKTKAGLREHQTRQHINQQNEAATKIQSSFRGYQHRKNNSVSPTQTPQDVRNRLANKDQSTGLDKIKGSKQKIRQPAAAREDSYDELDRENQAALTIQSHYRGYQTRKSLVNGSANQR